MKVGIIGIGDICKKAYLPLITTMSNLELVLCTRNKSILEETKNKYRISTITDSIDSLIKQNIQCAFIHSSTESHFSIAKELIKNNIPVYIDKPISYDFNDALELLELSKKYNTLVMIGFNRRFAPMYKNLKSLGTPSTIIMEKNRTHLPDIDKTFIFDDFIHVADTLRYLMNDDYTSLKVNYLKKDGLLYNVVVTLSNSTTTAIGIMNRDSGKNEEKVSIIAPGVKAEVIDLVETTLFENSEIKTKKFNDWENTLVKRGFHSIISEFLDAVKNNRNVTPNLEDSIKTHKLCQEILVALASDDSLRES